MATDKSNLGSAGQVSFTSLTSGAQLANGVYGGQLHGGANMSPGVAGPIVPNGQVLVEHTSDPPIRSTAPNTDHDGQLDTKGAVVNAGTMPNAGLAAGVITGMFGKVLASDKGQSTCFLFQSTTTMQSIVKGCNQVVASNTLFRVNARAAHNTTYIPDVLTPFATTHAQPSAQHATAVAELSTEKISLPYPDFDLCAVVERLAKAISKFAVWGALAVKDLCSAEAANIRILNTRHRAFAGHGEVYIPGSLWYSEPQAAVVITYAVSGAGSQVVLDPVCVGESGRPNVPDMSDGKLALACYRALYLLGVMHDYAGLGSHWAYAFTRGIHSSATVIAHTDEGGYVRSVLRRGAFQKPFGVIVKHEATHWAGMSPTMCSSLSALQSFTMSCLLVTAAAVAVADPTVTIGDSVYPEVITVNEPEPMGVFGCAAVQPNDREVELLAARAVASNCTRFCKNYIYVLTKLFGFFDVNYKPAEHFAVSFTWFTVTDTTVHDPATGKDVTMACVDRHLLRTGHYWFWIEPTGILPAHFDEMPASKIWSGPRAVPGEEKTYPALPMIGAPLDQLAASGVILKYESARRMPAIDFLRESPTDGLAFLRIARMDPQCIACAGIDDSNGQGNLINSLMRKPTIQELLWTRGDARVNAPCELMALNTTTAMVVVHNTCVTEAGGVKMTPLPLREELAGWNIRYSVAMPKYVGVHDVRHVPTKTRQMRSRATTAFAAAANAYNKSKISYFDWMGPTDDTYLTSLLICSDVGSAAVCNAAQMGATVGETVSEVLEAYMDDTADLTEPIAGRLTVDTPIHVEDRPIQIKQKHTTAPILMRNTMQPDKIGVQGLEPPPHEILAAHIEGYNKFTPMTYETDKYTATMYVAEATHRGGTKPANVMVATADDHTGQVIGGCSKTGAVWVGTIREADEMVHGVPIRRDAIFTPDGKPHFFDWCHGVRVIASDLVHAYIDNLADSELSDRYAIRTSKAMPRRAEPAETLTEGEIAECVAAASREARLSHSTYL